MRAVLKSLAFAVMVVVVSPLLLSFVLKRGFLGRDRALEGSTEMLALIPGLPGNYARTAFLSLVLTRCHRSSTIRSGTIFSQAGAMIDANVYVGPGCHLGLVHLEANVLLAAGVHVPSGARTHGSAAIDRPIREQPGERRLVTIGEGSWVGSAAVILADVGRHCIVAAGAVVTKPLPDYAVAAGVPARVIRDRRTSGDA